MGFQTYVQSRAHRFSVCWTLSGYAWNACTKKDCRFLTKVLTCRMPSVFEIMINDTENYRQRNITQLGQIDGAEAKRPLRSWQPFYSTYVPRYSLSPLIISTQERSPYVVFMNASTAISTKWVLQHCPEIGVFRILYHSLRFLRIVIRPFWPKW